MKNKITTSNTTNPGSRFDKTLGVKTAAKGLPGLGTILGIVFAIHRATKGDCRAIYQKKIIKRLQLAQIEPLRNVFS